MCVAALFVQWDVKPRRLVIQGAIRRATFDCSGGRRASEIMWDWTILAAVLATVVQGSYIITAPRQWVSEQSTNVCLYHVNAVGRAEEHLKITLHDRDNEELASTSLPIEKGQTSKCYNVPLSSSQRVWSSLTTFEGQIGDVTINETRAVRIVESGSNTIFVQTDKYLYQPGQVVRLRILTIEVPDLKVSTANYRSVYVDTPSGTRIQQWLDVDNARGLVHLEFRLNEEVEEGIFTIHVKTQNNDTRQKRFKVEEYVLPRFEVTVTPQRDVLANDKTATVEVCARYTFGQPVRGNVSVTLSYYSRIDQEVTKHKQIVGCHDFEFSLDELGIRQTYIPYQMEVKTTLIEEGTDISTEKRSYMRINKRALEFEKLSQEEYVKPGLPYTAKMLVKRVDGSIAPAEPMNVCLWEVCKNMTTDALGILTVFVPTNAFKTANLTERWNSNRLVVKSLNYPDVEAENSTHGYIMHESTTSYYLERFFSPTNSSLILHVDEDNLDCKKGGNTLQLDLLFSVYKQSRANITVQVLARGQIQHQETREYEFLASNIPFEDSQFLTPMVVPEGIVIGSLKIPVHLKNSYSPEVKVLVWYSREDDEVVADVAEVNIQNCLDNSVSMAWSVAKAKPGDPAMLTVGAEPNSFCGYGIVDKSVELLSNQHDDLTVDKVFDQIHRFQLNEYIHSQTDDFTYCSRLLGNITEPETSTEPIILPTEIGPLTENRPISFPEDDFDIDEEATEIPETDTPEDDRVRRRRSIFPPFFQRYISDYADTLRILDFSGLHFITDLTVETRPCRKDEANFILESVSSIGAGAGGGSGGSPQPRPPPVPTSPAGGGVEDVQPKEPEVQSDPRTYFPETWLWDLILVPDVGQSVQDFNLPDTVTEWVGKTVCVHPQKGVGISDKSSITTFTPFFAELTLPPSVKRGEILPVKISVFNYQSTSLPVKLVLEASPDFNILGDTGKKVVASGVRSACVPASDKVTHTIRISPQEIGNINMTVKAFIDHSYPEPCGPEERDSKRDVLIKPLKVEAEGFPREKIWTKYICSKDLENNVDALDVWRVESPPNIVEGSERGFVTASGDLLGPSLENLDSMIQMPYGCGEQNMVRFAPNIYILQYLEASQQLTLDVVDRSKEFMQQGYQRELKYRHKNGSYSAFGESDDSGSTWLTAFVVKSYAQAQQYIFIDPEDLDVSMKWLQGQQAETGCYNSVGKVFNKALKGGIGKSSSAAPLTAYVLMALLEAGENAKSPAIQSAITCLLQEETLSTYARAITSYALTLAQHPKAENYIQQLLGEATKTPSTIFWDIPQGAGRGAAVETAGYVVLAMMTLDSVHYDGEALKIVKWISSKRNSYGGFVSTQDTVVALQALALFSSTREQGGANLTVTVGAENLQHSFSINEKNKILQQFVMLPTLPTDVTLEMTGQGCALLQAVLRYNVPTPDPADAFSLSVKTRTAPDKKCVTKEITACASYLLPDEKSNMAILEVKLVSGYVPVKDDLKAVVNGSVLFKRFEVDGSVVLFYIDELTSEALCATFKVTREVDVENPKPGTVRVYDYYQPEFSLDESYVLPSASECRQPWQPFPFPVPIDPVVPLIEDVGVLNSTSPEPTTVSPTPVVTEGTSSP
ncbi:alpha-1-inhibitor 3-like isoform X2 [Oratosquilla oratoria]|uniref:alpha-1-inhibitor 3-like isoform X2 n=1 Tax=Oratosquilla oratoria TaxID=337810 RepID=UPI003F76F473